MLNNGLGGAIVLNKIANIPSDNLKSPRSVTLSESFVSNEFRDMKNYLLEGKLSSFRQYIFLWFFD